MLTSEELYQVVLLHDRTIKMATDLVSLSAASEILEEAHSAFLKASTDFDAYLRELKKKMDEQPANTMTLVVPEAIAFIKDRYKHTVAYDEVIESWLTQWTVPNNFAMVLCGPEIADPVQHAAKVWGTKFLPMVRNMFGSYMGKDHDYANDFKVRFRLERGVSGQALSYVPCSNSTLLMVNP